MQFFTKLGYFTNFIIAITCVSNLPNTTDTSILAETSTQIVRFNFKGHYFIPGSPQHHIKADDLSSCILHCLNEPCCINAEFRALGSGKNCRFTRRTFEVNSTISRAQSDLYQRVLPPSCEEPT